MSQTITDTSGSTIAIAGDAHRQQVTIRTTGARTWVNFNQDAVVGQGVFVDNGDTARFWGERASANIYMVTEPGQTSTVYSVNGYTNMEIIPGNPRTADGNAAVELSGFNLDLAGRIRTSEKETIYTFTAQSMKNHTIKEKLVGSGTTTFQYDESAVDLNVTTASGDKVIRQSFFYCPYLAGSPVLMKATGVFATGKANVTQRIGMLDDNNGLAFEYAGTEMGIVRRTSTTGSIVNNRTAQSSWNVDPLDGTGPSRLTITDWNKLYLFWIEYLWQGAIGVRWGILFFNQFIPVHEYKASAMEDVPFIGKPSLPVRYEIENTGTAASNTTMKQVCVDVVAEGGHRLVGSDWSVSTPIASASRINVGTTEEVVLVVRLKDSYDGNPNRRMIKALQFNCYAESQDCHFRAAIVHEPTSVTATGWSDVDTTHSAAEYHIGQPTITGGDAHSFDEFTVPASNSRSGEGFSESRFEDTHTIVTQNVDSDNSDLLVIYGTSLATTTNVIATMKFLEFE